MGWLRKTRSDTTPSQDDGVESGVVAHSDEDGDGDEGEEPPTSRRGDPSERLHALEGIFQIAEMLRGDEAPVTEEEFEAVSSRRPDLRK